MKKQLRSIVLLAGIVVLSLCAVMIVSAEDLPIDINAINRHEVREGQGTTRIGANLFTRDSQIANEAIAEQVRLRQSAITYLFAEVPSDYEEEPRVQIISAAYNAGLFSEPTTPRNITPPQPADQLSIWIIVPIIALGMAGGFVWALFSRSKKKGQDEGVH